MKDSRVLIRAKGRGICIERGLYDCLQKELFTDVSLNYNGGKVRANKGVLAAASPVLSHLLKDWPITEDACIIMAGYTEEEVQGLVRYIYTGHLSAPRVRGTCWQKIIADFEVGKQLVSDQMDEIETTCDRVLDKDASKTDNKITLEEPFTKISDQPITLNSKSIDPKISVSDSSSAHPLIVKVQSLTKQQPTSQQPQVITNQFGSEVFSSKQNLSVLQPQITNSSSIKNSVRNVRLGELRASSTTLKKLSTKRAKASSSKLAKKKYVCPYCHRRFLTRGNMKNHIRIHNREKQFTCSICKDIFSYYAVFRRHVLKHRDKNEITEEEFTNIVTDPLILAIKSKKFEDKPTLISRDQGNLPSENEITEKANSINGKSCFLTVMTDGIDCLDQLIADEELDIARRFSKKDLEHTSSRTPQFIEQAVSKTTSSLEREEKETDSNCAAQEHNNTVSDEIHSEPNAQEDKADMDNQNILIIQCEFCPQKFNKWSELYIHHCIHTGEKPNIKCSTCDQEFDNIDVLKDHKRTHRQDVAYLCERCEKSFVSKRALMAHMLVHTYRLTVRCRYCPKILRTLKDRYAHERKHAVKKNATSSPMKESHADQET